MFRVEYLKYISPVVLPGFVLFVVKLYKDKITLWDNEITLAELEVEAKAFKEKVDGKYSAIVLVRVGVSDYRMDQLKEVFRNAKMEHVSYSTQKKPK
jgi:hypothetical protein